MNERDHHSSFEGKPAKSVDEIRRLLTSIHQANPLRPAGPYAGGLLRGEPRKVRAASGLRPTELRQLERFVRNPAYYRNLLLSKGTFLGAYSGGLLGFNIGVAAPIIAGWPVAIPLAAVLGLLFGSAAGIVMARNGIVRRRIDLFLPPNKFTGANGGRSQ
jgi:hypothetical protein